MENERLRHLFRQSKHFLALSNPQDVRTQLIGGKWFVMVTDNADKHVYVAREYDFKKLTPVECKGLLTEYTTCGILVLL